MPEPDTVFVASAHATNSPKTVHADRDCYKLSKANRIHEKDLAVYPPAFRAWCQHCGPDETSEAEATRGEAA